MNVLHLIKKAFCCLLFALTLLSAGSVDAQQKAMFTQYMFNGLAINPAYSSVDEALNITGVARQQWVGFEGAPNTQTFTLHTPIKESNTSVGFMAMRDQIGEVITETGAFITAAQRVPVGESSWLSVGINAGASKYVANYSAVSGGVSASDPVFADENQLRGNFGFGVMFFSQKFYAGFSSPFFYYRDLGNASSSRSAYRPHYMLQAGYLIDLGEDFKLKPNMLMKFVNGSPLQIDMNLNLLIKEVLWVGASYRSLDSFDAVMKIDVTPNITLGYSYDFTTTELAKVQKGSHEIMLGFRLPVKGRNFPRCYF